MRSLSRVQRRLMQLLVPPGRRRGVGTLVRRGFIVCAIGALAGALFTIAWFAIVCLTLPSVDLDRGLSIFDGRDRLVCVAYDEDCIAEPVKLQNVSKWVPKALIESEDRLFYKHAGVSAQGILRAMVANMNEGKFVQGGSTITQQLAKNVFFARDGRTFTRKIKDAAMALSLERRYKKNEILEAYLNTTYFGTGAYGIQRAAQTYFGKTANNLTLAESAYLVSLVNAPSRLSDKSNLDDATKRQKRLINDLLHDKQITQEEARSALGEKIKLRNRGFVPAYTYYVKQVIEELRQKHDHSQLFESGLRAFTCMDADAQRIGALKLSQGIRHSPPGVREGALVSVSVTDGGVLAIVGGVDGARSQWNRALSSHMAGSAFKPFVYLAGLNTGKINADSMLLDAPITPYDEGFKNYNPKNYDGQYLGWISTRKAIALSRNTCAVRVASATGVNEIIETAKKAGIKSKMEPNLSIALGACSVSPLELAGAYATLARGGEAIEPHLIRKVETRDKRVVEQVEARKTRVFEPEPVAELVDALQDVVEVGTGTRARLLNRPAAGKTGTSDGPTDIWFVGFTSDIATAVWGGNDEFKPIAGAHVSGGSVMARIWHDYMTSYYKSHPTTALAFAAPEHPLIQDDDIPSYEVAPPIAAPIIDYIDRNIAAEPPSGEEPPMPPLAPDYEPKVHKGHHPGFMRKIFHFLKSL